LATSWRGAGPTAMSCRSPNGGPPHRPRCAKRDRRFPRTARCAFSRPQVYTTTDAERADHLLQRKAPPNFWGAVRPDARRQRMVRFVEIVLAGRNAACPHDQCPMAIALKEDRAVRGQPKPSPSAPMGNARCISFPIRRRCNDEAGRLVGAVNMLVEHQSPSGKRAEEPAAPAGARVCITSSQNTLSLTYRAGRSWDRPARPRPTNHRGIQRPR